MLYRNLGPAEARRVLASGSLSKELEARLDAMKETEGLIEDDAKNSVIQQLVADILEAYSENPNLKSLPSKPL